MLQSELPRWKEKCTLDKVLSIIQLISAIIVLLCATLSILHVIRLEKVGFIYQPFMALMFLVMGLQYRNQSKPLMFAYTGFSVFAVVLIIQVYALGI